MSAPWFKFYPTDWRSDPRLRMCSMAARGLWVEMIALMHEAVPYGHLLVSGHSPTDAQLAVLAGAPSDQIPDQISELETAGVFSRTREGVIFSRKMTRMAKKETLLRKAGELGGNPKLKKGYAKPGYVYVIGRRNDGACKIGVSVNPKNRIKKIRAQYRGHDLKILGSVWTDDMGTLEGTLHKDLSDKCVGGEWFRLTDIDLKSLGFIKDPKGSAKEDPLPQKPDTRNQKEKDIPDGISKKTPRQVLSTVVRADTADAVLEHRQRIRRPLTATAASRLAAKFAKCADPDEAALTMVERGWQGFEPDWLSDEPRGQSPPHEQLTDLQRIVRATEPVEDYRHEPSSPTGEHRQQNVLTLSSRRQNVG